MVELPYEKNAPPSLIANHEFEPKMHHWREVIDQATGRVKSEAYDPRSDEEIDHDVYVAAIIHAFNPREDDVAQVALLLDALDAAHAFIVEQPCCCPSIEVVVDDGVHRNVPVTEYYGLQCRRCRILGRSNDEVIER